VPGPHRRVGRRMGNNAAMLRGHELASGASSSGGGGSTSSSSFAAGRDVMCCQCRGGLVLCQQTGGCPGKACHCFVDGHGAAQGEVLDLPPPETEQGYQQQHGSCPTTSSMATFREVTMEEAACEASPSSSRSRPGSGSGSGSGWSAPPPRAAAGGQRPASREGTAGSGRGEVDLVHALPLFSGQVRGPSVPLAVQDYAERLGRVQVQIQVLLVEQQAMIDGLRRAPPSALHAHEDSSGEGDVGGSAGQLALPSANLARMRPCRLALKADGDDGDLDEEPEIFEADGSVNSKEMGLFSGSAACASLGLSKEMRPWVRWRRRDATAPELAIHAHRGKDKFSLRHFHGGKDHKGFPAMI